VPGQHVELHEAARVEQDLEPLAGGELAPGVLALDGRGAPGVEGRLLELAQLLDPFPQWVGDGRDGSTALVTVERLGLGLLLEVGFFDRQYSPLILTGRAIRTLRPGSDSALAPRLVGGQRRAPMLRGWWGPTFRPSPWRA
jgi:hypothetical protein